MQHCTGHQSHRALPCECIHKKIISLSRPPVNHLFGCAVACVSASLECLCCEMNCASLLAVPRLYRARGRLFAMNSVRGAGGMAVKAPTAHRLMQSYGTSRTSFGVACPISLWIMNRGQNPPLKSKKPLFCLRSFGSVAGTKHVPTVQPCFIVDTSCSVLVLGFGWHDIDVGCSALNEIVRISPARARNAVDCTMVKPHSHFTA